MTTTHKVQADAINGIFLVSSLDDYEGCQVLTFSEFVDALDGLDADAIIGCELTETELQSLDAEWGVRR